MSNSNENRQLVRLETDRYIGGVCSGLSDYFNLDVTLIRLIFIASILLGGSGLLIYLILWIIIPLESEKKGKKEKTMSETKAESKSTKTSPPKNNKSIWGLFLVGLGIIMLLDNFGIGRYLMLDKTWPSIFIVLGVLILSR